MAVQYRDLDNLTAELMTLPQLLSLNYVFKVDVCYGKLALCLDRGWLQCKYVMELELTKLLKESLSRPWL